MKRRQFVRSAGAGVLGVLAGGGAFAQDRFPSRPVTLVIPFAAGGSTDLVIRPLAQQLEATLGAPFVVVNRPGAGGAIGAQSVARAKADGYTLLVGSAGPIVINPLVRADVGYNPTTDFAPIAVLGTQPLALAVHPSVPARTLPEFIALLKLHPGDYFYASSGKGSLPHLTGELLRIAAGVDITHVAFQGGGPAVQGTIAGNTKFLFDALISLLPHHNAGTLRILGVCDEARSPLLPQVPTMSEAGLPALVSTTSNYFLAPHDTPAQVVTALAEGAKKVMADAAFQQKLEQLGVRFDPTQTGARAGRHLRDEIAKWDGVIKRAAIKID